MGYALQPPSVSLPASLDFIIRFVFSFLLLVLGGFSRGGRDSCPI